LSSSKVFDLSKSFQAFLEILPPFLSLK
jgi:hypothetical protein